ncbi:hypothetical protein [Burkholderia sp. THE68]|uniref:hypothetical protein n=1 Tax=Burkholderia sp. THE68 TaxID=758782 RepID=UPI001389FA80|nr:hypothetical protein [Burkholderia sp. THE68]
MLGNYDRIVVMGFWIVGVSILGLFTLFPHHEQHAIEPVWSSRQQSSVVTGTVGSLSPATNVLPVRANSDEGEDIDADKPVTAEMKSSVGGPDAADELDSSPREASSQASNVERGRPGRAITQQPRRPAERKHAAPQSNERAGSAHDNTVSSGHHEAEIDHAESPNRDAMLPVQPALANSALRALPGDETAQPAIQSRPLPVDVPPPLPATPPPKSRQDVQDELRKARLNGSLPRFGNPDPYGPGGSPSSADR